MKGAWQKKDKRLRILMTGPDEHLRDLFLQTLTNHHPHPFASIGTIQPRTITLPSLFFTDRAVSNLIRGYETGLPSFSIKRSTCGSLDVRLAAQSRYVKGLEGSTLPSLASVSTLPPTSSGRTGNFMHATDDRLHFSILGL